MLGDKTLTDIQNDLTALGDPKYKAFHAKLIPEVSNEKIIGVRTPALRKYAKELFKSGRYEDFINDLPHRFYEEDNLHAFLLEQFTDYEKVISLLDRFLTYVDNWATCDMMSPKCFYKNTDKLYIDAFRWIDTKKTYAVRFGICMLMKHYLGDALKKEYMDKIASINCEEYYVKMAVAWYFATALSFNYEEALPYITARSMDKWTHNKAIQKACESYRVSEDHKEQLRAYKIK
jgi:3-methyladenine DNA glycosylase AlkD